MAKLSSDGKYVTVEKGDTLWAIAKKHLGSGTKYQQLANWNNISNPNLIYVGQKVYLSSTGSGSSSGSGSGSGSGSTSTTKTTSSTKVSITGFGLQSNTDNSLFVTWAWTKEKETEKYMIEWTYSTGDKDSNGKLIWYISNNSNSVDENNMAASRQAVYTIPPNAKEVWVRIKPISKKKTVDGKETTYWTASWSDYRKWTVVEKIDPPSAPSVEIDKYKLTASLENINIDGATQIKFQVYKNDGPNVYKDGKVNITATNSASYQWTVEAGGEYKVRCKAVKGTVEGEWSTFSSAVTTIPAATSGITTIRATSETSVYLAWSVSSSAETYDIEYTTKKTNFDITDQTTVKSGIESIKYEVTGLEPGQEYFFRVRAVNSKGESAWSDIKSVVVGKKPAAPTTWSSTTTGIVGEEINLYWVHNALDGSSQTYAELQLTINGNSLPAISIKNTTDEDEKDKISSATIDTINNLIKWTVDGVTETRGLGISLIEGVKIQWKVRTAGITKEYSDWSVERTIDIYAPPTLELDVTDVDGNAVEVLTSFPFYIKGLPGPKTQAPTSYHVSIIANESYETVDNIGNVKMVNQGGEVYSQYFDISQDLTLELLPSSVDLENGMSYTVSCTVSMDSGLTATETKEFSVSWVDEVYTPNAEISYDPERYVTHIRPYCMEYQTKYYKVEWSDNDYHKAEELEDVTLEPVYAETGEEVSVGILNNVREIYYATVYFDTEGNPIEPTSYIANYSSGVYSLTSQVVDRTKITSVYTTDGNEVLMGINELGDEIRYCITEGSMLVEDITLSVYRREYDGRFVEIGSDLVNTKNTFVTDPHPALDYARYRIVAISDKTGSVSYYDVPGYPINEVGIIIQWDEDWSSFDTTETAELKQPAWSGSLVRLPYNIDVTENSSVDISNVEYIGRRHPVSYYGTQLGITANWSTEIDKKDKDTIYALRRLMIWTGDVYVREPSGIGYWANINVSFNQSHGEVTVPISLDITRVEGGV